MSQLGGYYPTRYKWFDKTWLGRLIERFELNRGPYKTICLRHRKINEKGYKGRRVCYHCWQLDDNKRIMKYYE